MTHYKFLQLIVLMPLVLRPVRATAADEQLTVGETIGVVFASREARGGLWNFMSRANTDAKPVIYKILEKRSLERYHPNAILVLSYIGGKDDVLALESYLLGLKGQLSPEETGAIMDVFDALGIMARRGVDGALDKPQEMLHQEYWAKAQFRWYARDAIAPPGRDVGELVTWALWGYAKSEPDDLDEKVQTTFNAFDPKVREYLRNRSTVESMRLVARAARRSERLELDSRLRASLAKRWNGNIKDPDVRKLPSGESNAPTSGSALTERSPLRKGRARHVEADFLRL